MISRIDQTIVVYPRLLSGDIAAPSYEMERWSGDPEVAPYGGNPRIYSGEAIDGGSAAALIDR